MTGGVTVRGVRRLEEYRKNASSAERDIVDYSVRSRGGSSWSVESIN